MIGQLADEGGLGRREEEEAAPSAADTSRPAHPVDVLRHGGGGRVLQENEFEKKKRKRKGGLGPAHMVKQEEAVEPLIQFL